MATRASATLTLVSIFLLGTSLHLRGLASIGEIVTFTNFATMLIGRLEQVVGFVNVLFQQAAKIAEFFQVLDTQPAVADRPGARDAGRLAGKPEHLAGEIDNLHRFAHVENEELAARLGIF